MDVHPQATRYCQLLAHLKKNFFHRRAQTALAHHADIDANADEYDPDRHPLPKLHEAKQVFFHAVTSLHGINGLTQANHCQPYPDDQDGLQSEDAQGAGQRLSEEGL